MLESDVKSVKKLEMKCGLSPWSLEDYKREVLRNDSYSIVAKNPFEELKGFAISRWSLNGFENGDISKGKFAEIYNICVGESDRRQGIGRNLIVSMTGEFKERGISEVWLDVRKSNRLAIKFYEKQGFVKTYTRKNFYSKPVEDAVGMKLILSEK